MPVVDTLWRWSNPWGHIQAQFCVIFNLNLGAIPPNLLKLGPKLLFIIHVDILPNSFPTQYLTGDNILEMHAKVRPILPILHPFPPQSGYSLGISLQNRSQTHCIHPSGHALFVLCRKEVRLHVLMLSLKPHNTKAGNHLFIPYCFINCYSQTCLIRTP